MVEQTSDLAQRVEALEARFRRLRRWLIAIGVVAGLMLLTLMHADLLSGDRLRLEGADGAGVSVHGDNDGGSLSLASGGDRAATYFDATDSKGAVCTLIYAGSWATLAAAQDGSALKVEDGAGRAEASAASDTTGFYLYDKDGTLRAELSLTKQQPALIFYDAEGKELRRLRATQFGDSY